MLSTAIRCLWHRVDQQLCAEMPEVLLCCRGAETSFRLGLLFFPPRKLRQAAKENPRPIILSTSSHICSTEPRAAPLRTEMLSPSTGPPLHQLRPGGSCQLHSIVSQPGSQCSARLHQLLSLHPQVIHLGILPAMAAATGKAADEHGHHAPSRGCAAATRTRTCPKSLTAPCPKVGTRCMPRSPGAIQTAADHIPSASGGATSSQASREQHRDCLHTFHVPPETEAQWDHQYHSSHTSTAVPQWSQ